MASAAMHQPGQAGSIQKQDKHSPNGIEIPRFHLRACCSPAAKPPTSRAFPRLRPQSPHRACAGRREGGPPRHVRAEARTPGSAEPGPRDARRGNGSLRRRLPSGSDAPAAEAAHQGRVPQSDRNRCNTRVESPPGSGPQGRETGFNQRAPRGSGPGSRPAPAPAPRPTRRPPARCLRGRKRPGRPRGNGGPRSTPWARRSPLTSSPGPGDAGTRLYWAQLSDHVHLGALCSAPRVSGPSRLPVLAHKPGPRPRVFRQHRPAPGRATHSAPCVPCSRRDGAGVGEKGGR